MTTGRINQVTNKSIENDGCTTHTKTKETDHATDVERKASVRQ